jgi:hypothetical protein
MDFLALQPDCVIVRVFCGKVKAEHGGWIHGAPNGTADFVGHCAGVPVALESQASSLLPAQRRAMDHMLDQGRLELVKKVEQGARSSLHVELFRLLGFLPPFF